MCAGKARCARGKRTGAQEVIRFLKESKEAEMSQLQKQHDEKMAVAKSFVDVLREMKR